VKRSRIRRILSRASVLAVVALAVGVGATAAEANGTTGWYSLCSWGTYRSYMVWPDRGNYSSFVANPGQCVPIYMNGTDRGDIYGLYPGGYPFYVGSAWWQANVATTGNMGSWDWNFF